MSDRYRSVAVAVAVAIAAAVVLSGCSGSRSNPAPAPQPFARPGLYVAVGASETIGDGTTEPLREAWPQLLFGAMPLSVSFVNLGFQGATTADAIARQVPVAETLHPTVATVWLNVNDLINGVSAPDFEAHLRVILERLRAAGAAVYVANTPALDHLPIYLACSQAAPTACPAGVPDPLPPPAVLNRMVDDYNAATGRAAAASGAIVVDLHAASLAARADGSESRLISNDGFHPNAAGARRISDTFVAVLRATGALG